MAMARARRAETALADQRKHEDGAAGTRPVPLVIDLDGTLLLTDMLHESSLQLVRDAPWKALALPVWLAGGKAALKRRIAQQVEVPVAHLPYNQPLVTWLREQRATGRRVVLCTASDQALADAIAAHLGCFDAVMASDGATNLAGPAKAGNAMGSVVSR